MSKYKVDTIMLVDPKELKFAEGNRPTNDKHVARIKAALHEENLLHVNPIKINPKGEIIDGQHRVKAALELDLKTVTCLVVGANIDDAAKLNQHMKNWGLMDFANYWAKQGRKDYQDFIDFTHLTSLLPSVGIIILGGGNSRHRANFRKGSFKVKNLNYAYKFMERLEDFKEFLPSTYRARPFVSAFWRVYNYPTLYDKERMLKKMRMVGIKNTSDTGFFLEQLETAYNYKVRADERVHFTRDSR